MPGLPRPISACLVAVLLLLITSHAQTAKPPVKSKSGVGFAEALRKADSVRVVDSARVADSLRAATLSSDSARAAAATEATVLSFDSAAIDSNLDAPPAVPRNYRWTSPLPAVTPCPDALESASLCWREDTLLVNQDIGWPGTRGWTLSLGGLEKVPLTSPYFPGWKDSPYLNGGLLPPDRYVLNQSGGAVESIEEAWHPVIPLDTPSTELAWERGALELNVFTLRLQRMLLDRTYLALEYYSATADSLQYDYPFSVHQPYLGGWGFLGQIYAPIDRDSSSLVLDGVSPHIEAVDFRPRVGFWLDTNEVAEFFLDWVSNQTSLTWPRRPGAPDTLGPADSVQTLMPSEFSAITGGAVHGWGNGIWATQAELAGSALDKETLGGDSTGFRVDAWTGSQFRFRGRAAATGWALGPYAEAEAFSESWEGALFLNGTGAGPVDHGWTDHETLRLGLRPNWVWPEGMKAEADAGLERSSRMDDDVNWLTRAGAEASFRLPLGLEAGAGIAWRESDPDWEILYRRNPALFLYPSPDLDPQGVLAYRAQVSWKLPHVRIGAGAEISQGRDVWLPAVLPGPDACDELRNSVYGWPGASACVGSKAPDSLALGLRNWDREDRLSWHLALGLDLGNWSLDLRNNFLVDAEAEDDLVQGSIANRMVPARVFKGELGWKRSLLDDKLKVNVGWAWEWFSTRYAWVPDLRGGSAVGKLDEYLALDFQAGMRIKTFLLYFRGMNLNHDRYSTEPGVHPPGINFRFGIDWTLFN